MSAITMSNNGHLTVRYLPTQCTVCMLQKIAMATKRLVGSGSASVLWITDPRSRIRIHKTYLRIRNYRNFKLVILIFDNG
jgi:hypothetical protein